MTGARLAAFTDQAWAAFGADCGYAVEIARAAAGLAQRQGSRPSHGAAVFDRADQDRAAAREPTARSPVAA